MCDEVSNDNIRSMLVDNVLKSNVCPAKFDDVLSRILQNRVVIFNQHGRQLQHFHSSVINTWLGEVIV